MDVIHVIYVARLLPINLMYRPLGLGFANGFCDKLLPVFPSLPGQGPTPARAAALLCAQKALIIRLLETLEDTERIRGI